VHCEGKCDRNAAPAGRIFVEFATIVSRPAQKRFTMRQIGPAHCRRLRPRAQKISRPAEILAVCAGAKMRARADTRADAFGKQNLIQKQRLRRFAHKLGA
jgi:hypothetical protein